MADLLRQEVVTAAHTVVVKVGTRVLTRPDGGLDPDRIAWLAEQLHLIMQSGRKVALVSSGAVGAGMGQLGLKQRPAVLSHLQAVAAVGQAYLVQTYDRSLRAHERHAAQLLLTREDLEDRNRYLNVRNTLLALFEFGAVPIINENDTVSVEELQTTFGDNDRLAALVTNLIQAPLLILLSDVKGLYDGDPSVPGTSVIPTVMNLDDSIWALVHDKATGLSKGGMASKLNAARITTAAGASTIIASGREEDTLRRIMAGEPIGSLFVPQGPLVGARKLWIGFTVAPRGRLIVDAGAQQAVTEKGRSLLAIGITACEGEFDKGDVIALCNTAGQEFARGLTNYTAQEVQTIKGLNTKQIEETLGRCPYQAVIHRDNLLVVG